MDLSKLSDADLMALKSGDLSKVSDAGLMSLRGTQAPTEPTSPSMMPSQRKSQTIGDIFSDGMKSVAGGTLQHLGNIGATLMASPDDLGIAIGLRDKPQTLSTLVTGQSAPTPFEQRRADILAGSQSLTGGDPNSMAWNGAGLVTDIAGTAGVGGGLANTVRAVAPAVAARLPGLVEAIRTAGMTTGARAAPGALNTVANLATRGVGGAVTGGLSAGMVNPEDASVGVAVGGALPLATKLAGATGNAIGKGATSLVKNTLGMTTGVGGEPISQAFKAGQQGNRAFVDNMRGDVPFTDVLDSAKQGLQTMQAAKSAEYRSGMIPIQNDKTVLSLNGIDQALQDAANLTTFKGQVKNEPAANAVQKMQDIVDEWRQLDPAQFHTPEGLDALKQKLGGVLESISPQEKTAALAAGKVYKAAKAEIESQAPAYAKVMKDYSAASDQIKEIERALSLGNKASADTGMRKLQSLMRNNVNTNYGNRLSLANQLASAGGVDLLPSIAGQAMSSATPRGLAGVSASGGAMASLLTNPYALAGLPLTSPRVVGELAYGLGRASGATGNATSNALTQLLGARPSLNALADPDLVRQFGYRSAPVLAGGR
jgi:hypothetical protein